MGCFCHFEPLNNLVFQDQVSLRLAAIKDSSAIFFDYISNCHNYGAAISFFPSSVTFDIVFKVIFVTNPTLCRSTCGPRNRCSHLKSAGGAGVCPDIRLPHYLQSSLWWRWSRHEGGQRIWGERLYGVRGSRLNCVLTDQPYDTFLCSFLLIPFALNRVEIACKSQTGHLALWAPITLDVLESVPRKCLGHLVKESEWFLFGSGFLFSFKWV